MPLGRYTVRDNEQADKRTPRERLYALMEAHRQSTGDAVREERNRMEDERSEQARNWGNKAAQGAAMGASVGGPWGALVGGIAGSAAGMYGAYKDRKKSGMGSLSALGGTLTDFGGGIPNAISGQTAANAIGTSLAGSRGRRESGGDAYSALMQQQNTGMGTGAVEEDPYMANFTPEEKQALMSRWQDGMMGQR